MSEQGWRDFLSAEDVEDWVVLHGGPTAVFRVGHLVEAARLAQAIAGVSGLEERTVMSLAHTHLTVRLTREMWGTEARHIEVARAISAVAREHGATADRSAVQEVQLAVAAKPDDIDLPFWRRPWLCADARGQRHRSARPWLDGLDAGPQPREAAAARHARRRIGRS